MAAEVRVVLQRLVDQFIAGEFTTLGLHGRGCDCTICDGSGGIPGGLVIGQSMPYKTKRWTWEEVQVGKRVLLDLSIDQASRAWGGAKHFALGRVFPSERPDVRLVSPDGCADGLCFVLTPDNVERVVLEVED